MLYPFLSDGRYEIAFSEIQKVDGINQIRIYAEEPWPGHFEFKTLEFYIPSRKLTKLIGYSDDEQKKIIDLAVTWKDMLFRKAKEYDEEGKK